jgi:hypothetical protein
MAAISGMESTMKYVERALIVAFALLTSISISEKAIALAKAQPAHAAVMFCCGNPPPCPGMPMCPVN